MKFTLIFLLLATSSLYAAKNSSNKMMMMDMEMTPEQRVNMATVHENMASCLKSDKSVGACKTEMKENCKNMMGAEGCQMMKHDKKMKGRK